jgi:hypothetical protein
MDGRSILRYGEEALGGIAEDDRFFFFECLDKAAEDFIRDTRILRDTAVITTMADQQIYPLPADFINTYAKNRCGRYVGKYTTTAGAIAWPLQTSHEKIWQATQTPPAVPTRYTILDPAQADTRLQSAATADGAAIGGECQLTDTAVDFEDQGVNPRDRIQNLDDGSHGVVLEVVNATTLRTALFEGEANDWTLGDAYIITPYPCRRIEFGVPSPETGATFELPYIALPQPVFSEIGSWRIPRVSVPAICKEAAYKFNQEFDFDPKRDAHLRQEFTDEVKRVNIETAQRRLQGGRYNRRR